MRMSCNGCRVLRKGCSDDCSIRPCLEWIKSSDSQANATVFLAKFYGRAGLMNLINAGPAHLRPAIFKSLLYEACGRIVNPIYGSAGLLWSGSWQLCQTAAEAVLKGAPITQIATDAAETKNGPPLKAVDIRHVNKDNFSGSSGLNRVRTRCRFKRSGGKAKLNQLGRVGTDDLGHEVVNRSPSHESSLSHQSEAVVGRENRESESLASAETAEPELVVGSGPGLDSAGVGDQRADADDGEMKLKLSLGLGFEPKQSVTKELEVKGAVGSGQYDEAGLCKLVLGLDYPDH